MFDLSMLCVSALVGVSASALVPTNSGCYATKIRTSEVLMEIQSGIQKDTDFPQTIFKLF